MSDGCKSILFYSDAAEYGGHEAMTLEAVRCFCQNPDLNLSFAFYGRNDRLRERLKAIKSSSGNLALLPLDFRPKSLSALRALVSLTKIKRIKALMKQINPDVVVVSQGRIEASSMGLLAAKRAGFETISYIPMAHPVCVSGKPFALWLREKVNGYFYRLPDKIITISETARLMLLERGASSNIVVVPNGIEARAIRVSDRQRFRETHGIERDDYVVAVVGRIDFRQKGQDFALQAISRFQRELRDYRFLFIGGGPDEHKLRTFITSLNLEQKVQVLLWNQEPAEIYAGIDMLLIPSRFEGVPLVMLEAMSCGLPVVASNVDGMAELLPPTWLFPYGNCRALIDTLLHVRNSDNSSLLELHQNRIVNEFSTENFCLKLNQAVFE